MTDSAQRPLEMSPLILISVAVIMLLALVGLRPPDKSQPVLRVSDQSIGFDRLGVRVRPHDGWSYLANCEHHRAVRPTFLNESAYLIARLHGFPFQAWPPGEDELIARGAQGDEPSDEPSDDQGDEPSVEPSVEPSESSSDSPPSPADAEILRSDYAHVSIDWLQLDQERTQGPRVLVGRLQHGSTDLMVTVLTHAGMEVNEAAIRQFCDSIETLDGPETR